MRILPPKSFCATLSFAASFIALNKKRLKCINKQQVRNIKQPGLEIKPRLSHNVKKEKLIRYC
ncbi:hypothetical protein HMPREF9346_04034 [Escherichia coli MS 119-7]|nr:hypothetical protein HMPREF9346_04034 [Escherichia coli MS 119-7]